MEAAECSWIAGAEPDAPECIPPTPEPTSPSAPTTPWPTPTPEEGCCYGATQSTNSFCAGMDDNQRACEAAASCEWIVTDDPDECRLTTTTTPPAPTNDPEGCQLPTDPPSFTNPPAP